jgi:hypothetical protein
MNLKYQELSNALPQLPTGAALRGQVMAAAIGLALATRLPLPSAPVADLETHWNFHLAQLINDPISDLNEGVVFDVTAAITYVRMFWQLRYASSYPLAQLAFAARSPFEFFDTLAGVGLHVPAQARQFCNENKAAIFQLAVTVLRLINENGAEVLNG